MMEPLEAGERVLNGVRNNDLFIFSHPEFKDGMQERFNAYIASVPDEALLPVRVKGGTDPRALPDLPLQRPIASCPESPISASLCGAAHTERRAAR